MTSVNRQQTLSRRLYGLVWPVVRFVLIFGLAFLILKPFAIKILLAFMSHDDLLDSTVRLIPRHFSLYLWSVALKGLDLMESLLPSVLLSVAVGIIQVFTSTVVGYGLARFNSIISRIAFIFVIIIMLVPPQVTSIAQYLGFVYFGVGPFKVEIVNTFWPAFLLAFCGLGIKEGLYIYMMRSLFIGMPRELEQAAYIDGASPIAAFVRVILPNSRGLMLTVFLFSFCWQWTDISMPTLYFPNIKLLATQISVITVKTGMLEHPYAMYIARNAGAMLMLIPLFIVFIFCQKFLVKSIITSGIAN